MIYKVTIVLVFSRGTVLTEEEKEAIGTTFAAETNKRDEDAEM